MKKIVIFFALLIMMGCVKSFINPYEGDKSIVGDGGFYKYYISSKDVWLDDEFPDKGVVYYAKGLPTGENCKLLGYISDQDTYRMTKNILKLGGNVATQSTVSFPLKFNKNSGIMDSTESGGAMTVTNGYGSRTIHSYIFFDCKK